DAVRRSLQLLLCSKGLEVRAYRSARQAISDPLTRGASCLVADLVMPEIDGIELLDTLRREGWYGPAVLISGFLTDALEQQAREGGFAEVLRKPVGDSILVNTIRRLISAPKEEESIQV
ncbi:MAG TPA: response regulator, partial [Woeseiaceae bacterium]